MYTENAIRSDGPGRAFEEQHGPPGAPLAPDVLMQQAIEAEVLATIEVFLHLWGQRGGEGHAGFFAYVAEDFMGFGTGQGEYYPDRDTFHAQTQHEHEFIPYPITFETQWMKVRVLHPSLALAEGELKLNVQAAAETHVLRPRCSLLLERRDGRWLLVHLHISLPNAFQHEGDSLMELFKTRNQELERQVIRRTAELEQSLADLKAAQAQLVQQEKMASLGTLTAGVAHEIKNPLNFVNNFAALSRELVQELVQELAAEPDPDAVQAILADLTQNTERIEAHGRRADSIVRSMLEHARGSSSERRATDLNALVAEHVDLAWHSKRARMAGFDVHITKDLDAAVGQIEVVPQEIGRVVLNLIVNAFDAVGERAEQENDPYQPVIAVMTRRREGQVEVCVQDNGTGIPEAIQAKIFEPFFTTKPTGSGTGLGLSMAYDIVAQGHGGALTVESEKGQGATFIITLPTRGVDRRS